ncbi:MAG: methylmalonyl Co-A mutase-associated GTPase MeaB [Chloroflexota bacterium]|jgi:LAO/AO transport system kinase|nr:methylmalonyl Co-A mutase-associated GTPase MeaB [Chloroflexota bacterium]
MLQINSDAIRQGDRLALSRALTAVENGDPIGQQIQSALFPYTGKAHLVGVTGAPGTGKSTLVNQLAKTFRQSQEGLEPPKIAIIAVDPTSPFTGGALLGDRIRMQDLAGDKGIFIRSMASRGALGGLAHKTAAFTIILDSAGFNLVLIETVGAGQAEVDIAQLAHTVIVVEAPGLGDDIQAIKAGILEIADIIAVNKADRPGAENTALALKAMLTMAHGGDHPAAGKHMLRETPQKTEVTQENEEDAWHPPVQLVTATEGKGIEKLIEEIQKHKTYLEKTRLWQVKEAHRLRRDLEALIRESLIQQWEQNRDQVKFDEILEKVVNRKLPPTEAVKLLL